MQSLSACTMPASTHGTQDQKELTLIRRHVHAYHPTLYMKPGRLACGCIEKLRSDTRSAHDSRFNLYCRQPSCVAFLLPRVDGYSSKLDFSWYPGKGRRPNAFTSPPPWIDEHISWSFLYRSSGSPNALSALMKTDIDVDFLTKQQRIDFSEILDIDDNSPICHTWSYTSHIFPGTPDESPDDLRYAKLRPRDLQRARKETRRFDELTDGLPPGPVGIIGRGIDVIGTDINRLLKWKDTQHPNRSMRFILAVKAVEFQPEDWVDLIHGWLPSRDLLV